MKTNSVYSLFAFLWLAVDNTQDVVVLYFLKFKNLVKMGMRYW